jgi:hypothetical protein
LQSACSVARRSGRALLSKQVQHSVLAGLDLPSSVLVRSHVPSGAQDRMVRCTCRAARMVGWAPQPTQAQCLGFGRPLTCLPQSLCRLATSLKELKISWCSGLKCLPEWIKSLTALQRLDIWWCPDLERRCERGTGEDWHLISHIPNLQIGWRDD